MEFDLSMNHRTDDEIIDSLIQAITNNITGIDSESDSGRNNNLSTIKQASPETYMIVEKFIEAITVYSFLKSDKDLRLKGMDVWNEEKDRHKEEYIRQLENIKKLFRDKNWKLGALETELGDL